MWSANLYELWKVFQLVDNRWPIVWHHQLSFNTNEDWCELFESILYSRSSLYCYKTSLCRPHFSITLWVLVNSEHPNSPYLCLLVCHHKKWQTEATMRPLQWLNLWILVLRVFLVFLPILPFRLWWGKRDIYLRKKVINFRRFCSYIPWNLILDLQTCLSLLLVPLS